MKTNIWVETALRPEVLRRSWRVSLLVGTILVIINYSDRLFTGNMVSIDYIKIVMTYCVPFCVSTHASVNAIMEQQKDTENE